MRMDQARVQRVAARSRAGSFPQLPDAPRRPGCDKSMTQSKPRLGRDAGACILQTILSSQMLPPPLFSPAGPLVVRLRP